MSTDDRKQAIARLVAQGKMTREEPGCYPMNGWEGELPEYDRDVVRAAFPDVLEIAFDMVESGNRKEPAQWFAILEDGKTGEATRVPLGNGAPEDTDTLVEAIHAYFRGAIDQDNMDEASAALAAFDEME